MSFFVYRRMSSAFWQRWRLALVLGAFVAGGCSQYEPPEFRLNMQDILQNIPSHDPDEFRVTGREEGADEVKAKETNQASLQMISTVLYAAFGTPDDPYLFPEALWNAEEKKGLDLDKIKLASGPAFSTEDGKRRGLYRKHCAHCHGTSGDGAGPTAIFLNPYPRDYRKGVFKFKSTETNAKPTTADLKRVLVDGIPGTAMPSFSLLPNDEIEALVEYVKYLSVRGKVEESLSIALLINEEEVEPTRGFIVENHLQPVLDEWAASEEAVVNPDPNDHPKVDTPEEMAKAVAAGRELFQSKKAQCIQCHGPTALGDGWVDKVDPFDDWNKEKKPGEMDRWLLPRQVLKPRNLRLGIYRGGRRPLDLYRRVHAGIPGAQMPGAGPTPGKPATLTGKEIWQLVYYVRSLPFETSSGSPRPEIELHKARN